MPNRNARSRPSAPAPVLWGLALVPLLSGILLLTDYLGDLRANQTLAISLSAMRADPEPVLVSPGYMPSAAPGYMHSAVPDSNETVTVPEENNTNETSMQKETFPTQTPLELDFKDSALLPLFRINSDTVGWLRMEDTRIDYPVVKGIDNEYYLKHGFDREANVAGAVFMDTRNIGDGSDLHTLIYGHRMKDGSMFRDLEKYQEEDFYQSHREFVFQTLHGTLRYRVFSAYVTDTDFPFIQTRFNGVEYQSFLDQIQEKSMHPKDMEIALNGQSRIITLATCSRAFWDARFVVHAVLVK